MRLVWVSEDRCTAVEAYVESAVAIQPPDEVAVVTRETPAHIWSPPTMCKVER